MITSVRAMPTRDQKNAIMTPTAVASMPPRLADRNSETSITGTATPSRRAACVPRSPRIDQQQRDGNHHRVEVAHRVGIGEETAVLE